LNNQLSPACREQAMRKRITPSLILLCLLGVAGCGFVQYKPEPLDPAAVQSSIRGKSINDPGFQSYVQAVAPGMSEGAGGTWGLNRLTLAAVYYSPRMQVAYEEFNLSRQAVKTASQLINPKLSVPLGHHSDTSNGQSPWTAGALIEFIYEFQGKREARIARARALMEAAKVHVRETAWDLRTALHSVCLDYYRALQQEKLAGNRLALLSQKLEVLQARNKVGEAGESAVNRVDLAMQQARLDLANAKAGVSDFRHRLTSLTGLTPDEFSNIEFSFDTLTGLVAAGMVSESNLRESALLHRTDIIRALYEYNAVEQGLKLEIEKQYPDLDLSPGFIYDQGDKIWQLGTSWVLPLFHNNEGPINEALAQRKLMQARFIDLQTNLLNRLHETLGRYEMLQSSRSVTGEIQKKLEQQGRAIRNQFDHGYSNRLDMINAELDLNAGRQAVLSSDVQLIGTLMHLEEIVQKPLPGEIDMNKLLEHRYPMDDLPDTGVARNESTD
jgi:cobalt-zinc-cadmium efflux system outer membrane protein